MSKVDAQRAMREARYAAAEVRPVMRAAAAPKEAAAAEGRPVADPAARPASVGAIDTGRQRTDISVETGQLCGHRSIGGKNCQRHSGHSEKNHRYK